MNRVVPIGGLADEKAIAGGIGADDVANARVIVHDQQAQRIHTGTLISPAPIGEKRGLTRCCRIVVR